MTMGPLTQEAYDYAVAACTAANQRIRHLTGDKSSLWDALKEAVEEMEQYIGPKDVDSFPVLERCRHALTRYKGEV